MFQREFPFTLPRGYVDADGTFHREGVMRLATAADELIPQRDPRVQANPAYLIVLQLSRVVTRLGTVDRIEPRVIENMFSADLKFLQDMYNRFNQSDGEPKATCPHCGKEFDLAADAFSGKKT